MCPKNPWKVANAPTSNRETVTYCKSILKDKYFLLWCAVRIKVSYNKIKQDRHYCIYIHSLLSDLCWM
jgi:hypothetical protein